MPNIAIVVPTIRPEKYAEFAESWAPLFEEHQVTQIVVLDGKEQQVQVTPHGQNSRYYSKQDVLGTNADLICNFSPACRCLGFVAALDFGADVIITLDDDTLPHRDTIQDHLDALDQRVPISWLSTTIYTDDYMRGFPYKVKSEAQVFLSHGVWRGIPDIDSPTQLVLGEKCWERVQFYQGPIPRGVFAPICGMNLAFRIDALPFMYWCPCAEFAGAERFDDIWMGLYMKKAFDELGWAVVTGYATVRHERASNVFKNLQQEALGLEINETLYENLDNPPEEYAWFFDDYAEKRKRWYDLTTRILNTRPQTEKLNAA